MTDASKRCMKQTLSSRGALRLGVESLLATNIPNVIATQYPAHAYRQCGLPLKPPDILNVYIRHMILTDAIYPLARESAPHALLLSSDSCGRGRSYLWPELTSYRASSIPARCSARLPEHRIGSLLSCVGSSPYPLVYPADTQPPSQRRIYAPHVIQSALNANYPTPKANHRTLRVLIILS